MVKAQNVSFSPLFSELPLSIYTNLSILGKNIKRLSSATFEFSPFVSLGISIPHESCSDASWTISKQQCLEHHHEDYAWTFKNAKYLDSCREGTLHP